MSESMELEKKQITVEKAERAGAPLVVLHTVHGEGEMVRREVKKLTDVPFHFVSIGNIDWDDEMSPWPIPPIAPDDTPCSGGADRYLKKLTDRILPEVLNVLSDKPEYMMLAGYSLAGLFSVYAMYRTTLFSRFASASGSFWYPDFLDFVKKETWKRKPEKLYFSLGNKEAKTGNPFLKPVEENTKWLHQWYADKGIKTIFEMNPGNHFQHAVGRMAKGIAWTL